MILTPDSTTDFRATNHSYRWGDNLKYTTSTDEKMPAPSYYTGWAPVVHMVDNATHNVHECAFPSSLVYFVRDKYSAPQTLPSYPHFQCVVSNVHYMNGYAKIIPSGLNPFNQQLGGYSSGLLCSSKVVTDGSAVSKYAMIQPISFNSKVLINENGSFMNAGYYIDSRSNKINQYETSNTSISSFNRVTKVLEDVYEQGYNFKWCAVAVNFQIALKAENFNLNLAMQQPNTTAIKIPIYYSKFEDSDHPTHSFTFDDVYNNTSGMSWSASSQSIYRLDSTGSGFIRMAAGNTALADAACNRIATAIDGTSYVWLSGRFNFELLMGGGGCPHRYSSLSIGSPILLFRSDEDYKTGAGDSANIFMSCAETIELWNGINYE